ncbi:MAG: zinc-binding alcohol dehydrogenase family protein [Candidatus Sumerlaeia bacterium]|nr:zinc-binding alcohol dehydrogenase family protein [Candidatus Sumerlaeia bacterium]
MKAWLLREKTGLGALECAEVAVPEPAAGEVLVRVRFAALNPADYYLAENRYPANPPMPHVLGRDGVGVVERTGAGRFAPGDLVTILRGGTGVSRAGTLAEYVVVPEAELVPKPADWSDEEAAGAALALLTAHQALTQWGPLAPGATVVVSGATGGVGVASIQLGRAMGCRMVGLSRSAEKAARLRELGAELVLDPNDAELVEKMKDFAGRERVALVVDNVAGTLFPKLVAMLGTLGAISCVGRLAGPVPDFNTGTLFFRRNRIGGVSAGAYSAAEAQATWDASLALLRASGARPVVDGVFDFSDVQAAFARLKQGPMGKVLVRVGA